MKHKNMRLLWMGVFVVVAGCASDEVHTPKTVSADVPAPEPGTQAYYEQKIQGHYALDGGELLAMPSTTTTLRTLPRAVASPGRRPLPPGVLLPGGSASPRWTEGRVLQVVSTNMIALGKAVTNASGAVTFPQDCLVKLNGRKPTPSQGDWFRAPTMPDGDYSCTVEEENKDRAPGTSSNILGQSTAPGFRELAEPTYEEYLQVYERDCQAGKKVDPLVFIERITNAPPTSQRITRPTAPQRQEASETVASPADVATSALPRAVAPASNESSGTSSNASYRQRLLTRRAQQSLTTPYAYTVTNDAVTITKYNGPGGRVVITNSIDGYPVTTIGSGTFKHQQQIGDIIIPDTVTSIEDGAFEHCSALTNIVIPASVTRIADSAFGDCKGLQSILVDVLNPVYSSSADGILFNMEKTHILRYPQGKGGDYTIPARVSSIGEFSFRDCTALTRVQLPSGVTNIGDWAFGNCTNLSDIVLPQKFARLEEYFRIGIDRRQLAAMLDRDESAGSLELQKKYGCLFAKRGGSWMAKAEPGNDGMPLIDPRYNPDNYWLSRIDTLADKHGVAILQRSTLEPIETEDYFELPIRCREWNGTPESFVGFLNALRQQKFMIDVGQVSLMPMPQQEGTYHGAFAVRCAYRGGRPPTPVQASRPAVAPSQP